MPNCAARQIEADGRFAAVGYHRLGSSAPRGRSRGYVFRRTATVVPSGITEPVATYSVHRVDGVTTIIVSSPLSEPFYHWYVDGVYVGVTRDPRWQLYLSDGEQAHVEVIDTIDGAFDPVAGAPAAYPSQRTLWWCRSLSTDVASYRVEQQQDGGSWTAIATVHAVAEQWDYRHLTERLVDLAEYAWRVIPVDQAGNDGTAISLSAVTVVRWPDAPEWTFSFDAGTDLVTIEEE